MWAISNVFRSSTALRRHLESTVLASDRLSWTAFTALWVLWIWGEMESRDFAAAVGISRPTATGVLSTLQRRRFIRRKKAAEDGRVVLVSLTPSGRKKIEELFPRFNAEEAKVAAALSEEEQDRLASTLRTLLRGMEVSGGARS
jgi:DNA-binding MarR family transcriptional regulator